MKQSLCAEFALALALAPALAACESGETAEPREKSPAMTATEAFSTYARGGQVAVPWADTVAYRISGTQVARLDPGFADRRESWDGCPPEAMTYEGRDCPVSPLSTIAALNRDGADVVFETEAPPTVGCNRYQSASAAKATIVWIRPPEDRRDCFSDFAVAVSLDRGGRVVSVDLALSGP